MMDGLRNADRIRKRYATEQRAATLASGAWLGARGLNLPSAAPWDVFIALDVVDRPATPNFDGKIDTRFHVSISRDEWGFFFCHQSRVSWIRVTDVPEVNERDEHGLVNAVPALRDLGKLIAMLEDRHEIRLRRQHAAIRTSIAGAEPTIRLWVVASL